MQAERGALWEVRPELGLKDQRLSERPSRQSAGTACESCSARGSGLLGMAGCQGAEECGVRGENDSS